ncbi:MAG TPA: GAF domain-containing protein [Jatrophihabitans sp.]|nr:GAF domain-containing protein [Jatrophihabitans sp.]
MPRFPEIEKLELDELMDELVKRAHGVKRTQGRLRGLLQAIETVASDLALENVLRNVVEAGCELANAKYGALGVIGQDGGLEEFIHVGIDDATAARIGDLPQGKGLLGALISDPRPIRLRRMTDDARSTGFPPHHPPMDSFIGVPIHVRDEVYGNLYLAESAAGEFSAEDEALVSALAYAAGAAITNARLYSESQLQQRWLQASVEIGAQMLSSSGEDPLRLVGRRAMEIADADLVAVSLLTPDGQQLMVEVTFGLNADELIGRRFPVAETVGGTVIAQDEPLLLTDIASFSGPESYLAEVMETGPLMVLPLRGTGAPRGVLSLARLRGRRTFTHTDMAMAAGFASHASVALELADSRAAEQRLVLLEDRDRIAMDLHDHVIQELFAVGLTLEGAATQLGHQDRIGQRISRSVTDLDRTIRRIRTSIFQLRGNLAIGEYGLRQRLLEVTSELAEPLGFPPNVVFSGIIEVAFSSELMDDVVACVREALTNVARHAQASEAVVDVTMAAGELTVTVTDNGVGPGAASRRSGTANLAARAARRDGSFSIEPAAAGGTTLTWKVPVT